MACSMCLHFGKSAELLRTIGARFELAQTCYACGQSPAFEREERLSYLSSAHSLFSEMEVIPRLNEIKKLPIISAPDSPPGLLISRRVAHLEA